MKNVIVYVNQFFGRVGGEDVADYAPEIKDGAIGAAQAFANGLVDAKVTHTLICGDNYMGSNTEDAIKKLLGFLEGKSFDLFIAGPAFQAGRYGSACGTICKAVKEKFGVPVLTSMHVENPGVEMFKKDMIIFKGGHSAGSMKKDAEAVVNYANKLLKGEATDSAEEEGFYARGIRHQVWRADKVCAADRVIDMLLKKVKGEEFKTELPIPKKDIVPIATPITDLSKATIALCTSGGIVPVGNPDKIQSASATRWGRYSVKGMDKLENRAAGKFMTIHAGYDPQAGDADPNVVVPLDALRAYEKEGKIGKVYDYFFSTVGTGTTQAEAARMGKEIVEDLKKNNVTGVILTAT